MRVVQTVFGVFHHFELARQLERRGHLERVFSTWPWARVRREGIARDKVKTFPWIHTPEMLMQRVGIHNAWLLDQTSYANALAFDAWTDRFFRRTAAPDALIALSGSSLVTGQHIQQRGGRLICDRGSSHQRYQERLVSDEYRRWKQDRPVTDPRDIRREEQIYAIADAITVPSTFAARSFAEQGVPAHKVHVIPYGVRLENFHKVADPHADRFEVLFVGSVSLRKGVPYLLEAFQNLKCSHKRLRVVGSVHPDMHSFLRELPTQLDIEFIGSVEQHRLPQLMSSSHVMVLPSIEEGLALVQGQALACGCPVIATSHTGAEDLFTDGVEGFILPIRRPDLISNALQQLCDDPSMQQRMSHAALARVHAFGGWNQYGDNWERLLVELVAGGAPPPTK